MSAKNTINSFGFVAKSFHWVIAFLIIAMLVLGYFLEDFPASTGEIPYNTHKTIGIIILALVALRLSWRWFNIQPGYSATLPPAYKVFVRLAHYAIYLVIIAMPISGWVMSTAAGHIPHFLGWFYFPMPGISLNENLANQMFQLHNFLAIVLIVLVSFHVLAALIHHFVLKDDVLKRMLPGKK
ncbi:MAG: cytochrome b [Pseudomonadota bacterium]